MNKDTYHSYTSWQHLIDVFSERNSKINLSAIRTPDEIYQKHILDALQIRNIPGIETLLYPSGGKEGLLAADIGTGGGFPLLPLATLFPTISRTGIDARRKKIDAINDMISQLGIANCKAIHTRVEEHKQKYDIVTARAVAYSTKLLPRIDHILKKNGCALLYKLYTPEEDLIIDQYGWKIIERHMYTLDDTIQRCLYVMKK